MAITSNDFIIGWLCMCAKVADRSHSGHGYVVPAEVRADGRVVSLSELPSFSEPMQSCFFPAILYIYLILICPNQI